MSAFCPPVVWLPFLFALLPMALPEGVSARRLAEAAVLGAVLTTILAGWASLTPNAVLCGAGVFWRNDPLTRTATLVPAVSWLLVSLRGLQPGETARPSSARWRRWPVSAQGMVASALAFCRADSLAVLPLLLGAMLLLGRRDEANGREIPLVLGAVPMMAAGTAVLSATGEEPRWSLLGGSAHATSAGLLLLLLPVLLVCAWGFFRPVLFGRSSISRGLLRVLLLGVAVSVSLRCLRVEPFLAPLVFAAGLALGVLALLLIPAHRSLAGRVSLTAALQAGMALAAVASGGPGGVAAALMLTGFLALLLPLVLSVPLDRSGAGLRSGATLVLIGLPPFGPFAAFMVLMLRLMGDAPIGAALLLLGAAVSALSVLQARGRDPSPTLPGGRFGIWPVAAASVLAVLLWLGLAMPTGLSDWLLSIAGGNR